jgi:hypothetical protein
MEKLAAALLALCLSIGAAPAETTRDRVQTLRRVAPQPIVGQPEPSTDQSIKWATGEVAGELQECSVYFGFVEYCIAAQRPDLARNYHAAKERLNELALKSHLAAGLSGDAYLAMLPLHAQNMRELLGNREALGKNCSNIAVLLNKYMNFCQRLSQDADPRLIEWIACIRANQQTCDRSQSTRHD